MRITEEEIKEALDKAYRECGHNAYFSNGFIKGMMFVQSKMVDYENPPINNGETVKRDILDKIESMKSNDGIFNGKEFKAIQLNLNALKYYIENLPIYSEDMREAEGDLIEMALGGHFDVIVHECNRFNTVAAEIAEEVKQHFPEAYQVDKQIPYGNTSKMGTNSYAKVVLENGKDLFVVNTYTQHELKMGGKVKVDYDLVRDAFRGIKEVFSGLHIAYPAIGAGLAGGDWNKIKSIINEELAGEKHTFVKYKKT